MNGQYILDSAGRPVPEPNALVWRRWLETANNRVLRKSYVKRCGATLQVSTVFLGLDHSLSPSSRRPVLWETIIFGPRVPHVFAGQVRAFRMDLDQFRYHSADAALRHHRQLVRMVRQGKYDVTLAERIAERTADFAQA